MEIRITAGQLKKWAAFLLFLCFFVVIAPLDLLAQPSVKAQPPVKIYTMKNGRMYIELSKLMSEPALDSFIRQFNLSELALKKFIKENNADSIKMNGWQFEKNNNQIFAISKALLSPDNINNPAEQLILSVADRFPPIPDGLVLGYNKFKKGVFEIRDSTVKFFLRNHTGAKRVTLAGSFNRFSPGALPMERTDTGWVVNVKLGPGKYWYKFIVDGNWQIDEDNQLKENDGEGNTNSVYYKPNVYFRLHGYNDAKKVYLAGSFNNWQRREILMKQTITGWELPVYLAEGTHTYRYIVDGNWITDPGNSSKVPNEFGEFNSLIRIGMPYLFRLNGFTEARKVILTGSFNGWRKDELFMNKTGNGWELPYTLGLGNYEYKFIVDGTEMTDPVNPIVTNNDRKKGNSVLILGGNYTFRLKGFGNAKKVILAGDFNSFNESAYVMNKEGDEWVFTVHLSAGKHLYKFIVDGKWIIDPGNKLWEQNEYGTGNSVIWIDVHNRQ